MISSCRQMDEHPPLLRSTPFKGGRSWVESCSRGCVSKANVSYEYRGDGKRHSRTAGGVTTRYGWDMGWNVIHEESAGGTLQKSYVMHSPEAEVARILADIAGTNPATGTTRYYAHDHLGSTRNLYSAARQTIGTYWYTPYGDLHNQAGVALETLGGAFTGKPWDPDAQLYYFPYRYYSPKNARWLTRDPLGMADGPNVYAYVKGNPVILIDPLGQFAIIEIISFTLFLSILQKAIRAGYSVMCCMPCLRDCMALAKKANQGLPLEDYKIWILRAKPCLECTPVCGAAAEDAMNAIWDAATGGLN